MGLRISPLATKSRGPPLFLFIPCSDRLYGLIIAPQRTASQKLCSGHKWHERRKDSTKDAPEVVPLSFHALSFILKECFEHSELFTATSTDEPWSMIPP